MTPLDFDQGVDKSFLQRVVARIDAGETVTFESSHRRKDGTLFPVEVRVRQFWHERHQLALSLARDIASANARKKSAKDCASWRQSLCE